jgi:hypothetical protein
MEGEAVEVEAVEVETCPRPSGREGALNWMAVSKRKPKSLNSVKSRSKLSGAVFCRINAGQIVCVVACVWADTLAMG